MTAPHVDIWNKCLQTIKENIPPQSFETWFQPIKAVRLHDSILTIQVPSQFFYEFLEEHYVHLLRKTIKHYLGQEGGLEYSIVIENNAQHGPVSTVRMPTSSHTPNTNNKPNSWGMPENNNRPIPNPFVIPGIQKFEIESNLSPTFTFDNFIEGDCNRLARSAGYAVANKPGFTAYNPLFIFGGVGLGKTHLIHAIGNQIKNIHPQKTVLYLSSERFANQFIQAVKNNTVSDFMNFYQLIDVLIIDDIQFFSGKPKTQDNFFHIFNHLRQSNKQIILTADCPPHTLNGMEERLLSRFKWGLSTDLQLPSYETRISILKNKMYKDGIELPEEVVEYIAYNIRSNVRELEGALISLLAQSYLNRRKIDLELARSMLKKFVKNIDTEVSIDAIQTIVAEYFGIDVELLKAKTRKRKVVQARQISMYFAKELTKHSLKSIGLHFGGRDHSTVIHSIQTVNNLTETDPKFRKYVDDIKSKLNMQFA